MPYRPMMVANLIFLIPVRISCFCCTLKIGFKIITQDIKYFMVTNYLLVSCIRQSITNLILLTPARDVLIFVYTFKCELKASSISLCKRRSSPVTSSGELSLCKRRSSPVTSSGELLICSFQILPVSDLFFLRLKL